MRLYETQFFRRYFYAPHVRIDIFPRIVVSLLSIFVLFLL